MRLVDRNPENINLRGGLDIWITGQQGNIHEFEKLATLTGLLRWARQWRRENCVPRARFQTVWMSPFDRRQRFTTQGLFQKDTWASANRTDYMAHNETSAIPPLISTTTQTAPQTSRLLRKCTDLNSTSKTTSNIVPDPWTPPYVPDNFDIKVSNFQGNDVPIVAMEDVAMDCWCLLQMQVNTYAPF